MTSTRSRSKKNELKFALLYEVSRAVVSSRYLEDILQIIVGLTADLMGSKVCSLMILDAQKQELTIQATQSLSFAYRNKPPLRVGESVSGRAVRTRQPIVVLDVRKEAGYKYPEIAKQEGLVSLVAVPMMVKDKVIGVLNCYTTEPRSFTQEEIQLLAAVSNQAALAIENTRLLTEKAAAVEQLETRKAVEKAKGVVMKRYRMDEEHAYRFLQKLSMDKRRTMKEVAESVLLTEDISAA
jgi:GAF domain-containing protein